MPATQSVVLSFPIHPLALPAYPLEGFVGLELIPAARGWMRHEQSITGQTHRDRQPHIHTHAS